MATIVWSVLLAQGHAIRGGIEFGLGAELDGQVYGGALAEAYRLESNVARWPRIVIGRACVEYLNHLQESIRERKLDTLGDSYAAAMALKGCGAFLERDREGYYMLDVLGEYVIEQCKRTRPHFEKVITDAHDVVRQKRDDFRQKGNQKLIDRYEALIAYFERKRPIWQGSWP